MLFAFVGQNEVIYFGIFGAFVFGVWSVLSFLSNRNSRAAERLDRLNRGGSSPDSDDPKLSKERFQGVMDTAKALAGPLMPKTELEQSQLKVKLANAGFRSESAANVYLGLKSEIDKGQARVMLRDMIAQETRNVAPAPVAVTLRWFYENRFLPQKEEQWKVFPLPGMPLS